MLAHVDSNVSIWLDVVWVLDYSCYSQETIECEKASSAAVLDTIKPVQLAPATIPVSKALTSFVLPIHHLNGTHAIYVSIVSRLQNPTLTCLLPFVHTD